MEAVGRLAGGVAHDFNNLLTVIIGRTEVLQERLAPDAPGRRDLDLIRRMAERAAALTQQLLAFSRKQVLQPKVLDLSTLVSGVGTMLLRLIGEDVELVLRPSAEPARVVADPGQIEQVIMNLVVNARDAMPGGGRLTIETAIAGPPAGAGGAGAGRRRVVLTVSDTGVGMDAKTRAHIFEPFFTTKETGKGTGLGLSTVLGIVEQSGGTIDVESEPGRGTTFRIALPEATGREEAREARAAPLEGSGRETVLLVEDEDAVRELAREVLERAGYRVLAAIDGEEALAMFDGAAEPVQLIVTDTVMPRLGGRELIERIAARRPGVPALFMSGYTDDVILSSGVSRADLAFLSKPFTPADLILAVRKALRGPRPGDAPAAG